MSEQAKTTPNTRSFISEPCYIFPDTNLFLQARALQELPWNELAADRDIVILVPRAVQKELSRLKGDGSSRRAKRARAATSLLLQAAKTPSHAIVIREDHPRVTLQLPARTKPAVAPDDLDPNSPDDQIMMEVIAFRAAHPEKEALILTGDSDQIVSATHLKVPYCVIPDTWLLPPEHDEREKRILELERELRMLKKSEPSIQITSSDMNDNTMEEITIERDLYDPLPEAVIEELIHEAQQRRPREEGLEKLAGQRYPLDPIARAFAAADLFHRYEPPSADEINKYYERDYPAWINALRTYLAHVHTHFNIPTRFMSTTVLLLNNGTRPADGVILTVAMHGGLKLATERPTAELYLPQPPKSPTGRNVNVGFGVPDIMSRLSAIEKRDMLDMSLFQSPRIPIRHPNTFYREYGDQPTDEWRLNCDEFRHGDQERLDIGILIPAIWQESRAALIVTMTARNMSTPATKTIPVQVQTTHRDTLSRVRSLLDQQLMKLPNFQLRRRDNN